MLKIIFNNVMFDYEINGVKIRESSVELSPDLTLEQAVGIADLSSYYPLSGAFSFNNEYVPYIISNHEVKWNVAYREAKVLDFISTHNISDNTIKADEGYPQAGGPGFKNLLEIWNEIYPIIDQFVTIIGAVTIFKKAGKWTKSLFKSAEVPPQSYFDLIFSRCRWNHFELSQLLRISAEDSKRLLISLGYKYNKSILMYVQQPIALELKEKLSKVEVHDI